MTGRVTLLGAGPGDPELLTLLGWRRLQEATVVLYDRLVNPSLLLIPDVNTKLINVGKARGTERLSQDQINALLVQYAQAGEVVVRLKAGDPYVFGRGGEEAQYLAVHHINFEVVPGLTSAITGLSAAGIPITNRQYASSFHDMDFMYDVCDYFYLLNAGQIIAEGTKKTVFANQQLLENNKLEQPWLVKLHQKLGLPLYNNAQELFDQHGRA